MLTKKLSIATIALASILGIGATESRACGSCHQGNSYRQQQPTGYTYETVTKWVVKSVPYQKQVVAYKPCGTPYYTWKTFYQTVRIPVTYRVKVWH